MKRFVYYTYCPNCETNLGGFDPESECPYCTNGLEYWKRPAGLWGWLFGKRELVWPHVMYP